MRENYCSHVLWEFDQMTSTDFGDVLLSFSTLHPSLQKVPQHKLQEFLKDIGDGSVSTFLSVGAGFAVFVRKCISCGFWFVACVCCSI